MKPGFTPTLVLAALLRTPLAGWMQGWCRSSNAMPTAG
jgi:hypothetical protein